jgi:aminomethyltransferase
MTEAPPSLRRSPIDDRHRELGATMTAFAGWDMPLHYGSVVAEHRAVREGCGVFDLSHLGTLRVTGGGAGAALRGALSGDATALPVGRAHYSLCLNDEGGIVDDLLVYRLGWGYLVVPNAANAAEVGERIRGQAGDDTEVADIKADLACLAIQGPQSADAATAAGLDVSDMGYLDCREGDGGLFVLARSGYTGEHGYEAFVTAERAGWLLDRVLAVEVRPVGLGARDTLRLEMGYPLHGNDISPSTSPVEAGLNWAVKPDAEFVGREAYLRAKEAGPRRRLRGLRATGRGIPRAHCTVLRDGAAVGETTSGTFSPTLGIGVALGYLDTAVELGEAVEIDVRGKRVPAEVVKPPFVDSDPRR